MAGLALGVGYRLSDLPSSQLSRPPSPARPQDSYFTEEIKTTWREPPPVCPPSPMGLGQEMPLSHHPQVPSGCRAPQKVFGSPLTSILMPPLLSPWNLLLYLSRVRSPLLFQLHWVWPMGPATFSSSCLPITSESPWELGSA